MFLFHLSLFPIIFILAVPSWSQTLFCLNKMYCLLYNYVLFISDGLQFPLHDCSVSSDVTSEKRLYRKVLTIVIIKAVYSQSQAGL